MGMADDGERYALCWVCHLSILDDQEATLDRDQRLRHSECDPAEERTATLGEFQ